jgi:hypothetical protein
MTLRHHSLVAGLGARLGCAAFGVITILVGIGPLKVIIADRVGCDPFCALLSLSMANIEQWLIVILGTGFLLALFMMPFFLIMFGTGLVVLSVLPAKLWIWERDQ